MQAPATGPNIKEIMATIIERDSSSSVSALLIFIIFAALLIGGFWFAYNNGMLPHGGTTVNKTIVMPVTPVAPR